MGNVHFSSFHHCCRFFSFWIFDILVRSISLSRTNLKLHLSWSTHYETYKKIQSLANYVFFLSFEWEMFYWPLWFWSESLHFRKWPKSSSSEGTNKRTISISIVTLNYEFWFILYMCFSSSVQTIKTID